MKNKLIYPIYAILFFFILSIGKLAFSRQFDDLAFPGTRWQEQDNFIGASKSYIKDINIKDKIEPIEFAEDISIPELPNLPDVPLTEEDK
tara:strand:+ start:1355 stop:1624 length:270 start_codon:yes stop_codon:yes gene_type:complete